MCVELALHQEMPRRVLVAATKGLRGRESVCIHQLLLCCDCCGGVNLRRHLQAEPSEQLWAWVGQQEGVVAASTPAVYRCLPAVVVPIQTVSYNDMLRQDKRKMAKLTVLAMVVVLQLARWRKSRFWIAVMRYCGLSTLTAGVVLVCCGTQHCMLPFAR